MLAKCISKCVLAMVILQYIIREKDPSNPVLARSSSLSAEQISQVWEHWQDSQQAECKFQAIHDVLSFREDELKQLGSTKDEQAQAALLLAQEYALLQFGNRRVEIAVHGDGHSLHAHIVSEIYDKDGKAYNRHNDFKRAMANCALVAKEHDLIVVDKSKSKDKAKNIPTSLMGKLRTEIDDAIVKSKGDMFTFRAELNAKGIKVEILKHKLTKEAYGIRFKSENSPPIAGSKLGDLYKFTSIMGRIENELVIIPKEKAVEKDIYSSFRGKIRSGAARAKEPSRANAIAMDIVKEYENLDMIDKTILMDKIAREIKSKREWRQFELLMLRKVHKNIIPPTIEKPRERDGLNIGEIVERAKRRREKYKDKDNDYGFSR